MLDALLAEARVRWALDPADGVQVATAERLVASPIEPARPLLIVPLAVLLGRGAGADGAASAGQSSPPSPLPGRAGPGGDHPLTLLRRLYPADHPVGRFGRPRARRSAS